MFIDSSALVAVIVNEKGSEDLAVCMGRSEQRIISAVTQVEASIAVGRHFGGDHDFGAKQISDFIDSAQIEVLAVSPDMVADVLKAYQKYGKGTGHAAKLNFGDCFSYAFAKRLGMPLLFKGEDFVETDVERVR